MRAGDLLDQGKATLRAARENLSRTGDERVQAQELLEHVLGHDVDEDEQVPAAARRRFDAAIARRAQGEPIPYIVGWAEFRDMKLMVRRGGFIPRATTEFLAEQAIAKIRRRRAPVALDVACGIGPVAMAIAREVSKAEVHATDLSGPAIALGKKNATALGLRNLTFHRGDLFGALPANLRGRVDVIASHPPYVARREVRELPAELKDYEPEMSLTDSKDGLWLARRVIDEGIAEWLAPGGWLCMEVGSYLAREVRSLFTRAGYTEVASTVGDMKYTRVILGRA